MKLKAITLLIAVSIAISITGCSNGNSSSIFTDVNIIDTHTGQRGVTTVDPLALTDELLHEFFHEHIDGANFNFFTIDFEDGTGLVFPSSRNWFSHATLSSDGAMYGGVDGGSLSGSIYYDHIIYSTFDAEGYGNGIYEVFINIDNTTVYRVDRIDGNFERSARNTSPLQLQLHR